ncbi:MAG: hypothetical protein KAS75_03115 [Planctomycetes bacterium]|nr:hypothetical protein [Planctomycetota bacterium]
MCYLTQLILAARNGDGNGADWMNILVLVVLAAFYGLGGILKAKANKLEDEQQPEQPEPAHKPPHPQRRKINRHKPSVRKIAPQAEPADRLLTLEVPELTPIKETEQQTVAETLFDFDDADGLKRAILYYEILGKPLSLRDSW